MKLIISGDDLREIRQRLALTTTELGRAFGYAGADATTSVMIRKFEAGQRPLPIALSRLAVMFDRHGVPGEWTKVDPSALPLKGPNSSKDFTPLQGLGKGEDE